MPTMNGIEATQAIRRLERENNMARTPIVAITAHAIAGDREKFLNAGLDDYISKPISSLHLEDCLNSWLAPQETEDDTVERLRTG